MPFIETTTSAQDGSYDSDGYYSVTRTFKVWGVTPVQCLADPTLIPHRDANATPPVADKMPQWGTAWTTTAGPNPILSPGGERVGISVDVVLVRWSLRPVSAVLFETVAHYTNDPRIAPMGSSYAEHSQYAIVNVPIVRKVLLIGSQQTNTSTAPFSWTESAISAYMPVRRISQTVCVIRNLRKSVQDTVTWNGGKLVYVRNGPGLMRSEGADIRSRGAQWLDVTYNFTQEIGVRSYADLVSIDAGHQNDLNEAKKSYLLPPGAKMAFPYSTETYFLPPYHTVELVYIWPGNTVDPRPVWIYRAKGAAPEPGNYLSLPGEDRFEWNWTR